MFKKLKQDELNPNKPTDVESDNEQQPADMGQKGDNESPEEDQQEGGEDTEQGKLQQIVDNLSPEECTQLMQLLQDKQKSDKMSEDINFDDLT